jgi:predicted RNA-binding Zn-ribbon protein involved in translation (DUF1610 family)
MWATLRKVSPIRFQGMVSLERQAMVEEAQRVQCPTCKTIIPVESEWRLVQCPGCGGIVTRMGEDGAYD